MKRFLAVLAFVCTFAHADQPAPLPLDACKAQLPYGTPTTKKQAVTPICRGAYFTIHDDRAKIPVVSAYVLTPEHSTGCSARDSSFEVDRSLPPLNRAGNKDYAKSGYDIGHMVNAEDLKFSEEAQAGAALLSNAAPQLPEFNRGVWKKLEDTTRGWALSRQHPLLVYVAPMADRKQDGMIGKGFVTVPHGFVKILVDTVTNEVQVFSFKHEGSKEPLKSFIMSLADAQKGTGVQFPMPPKPVFGEWKIDLKSNLKAKAEVCSLR
jgi:endonuclease G, mitochondrial